jgi:hypothetical protein
MKITAIAIAAGLIVACAAVRAAEEVVDPPPTKPLDLRAPDITRLYTQRQLERMILKMEAEHIEEVRVEGAPVPPPTFTPRVWPGIFAPFWALFNPTQAWRIIAPMPPDQARHVGNEKFDTAGYLEPIGVPSGDPFK